VTIQWFPGHMAKARRQIEEKLTLIDIVFELLDARIPLASRNPMMNEITRQKPRLILLNKADLADPSVTDHWVRYFAGEGQRAVPIDSVSGRPLDLIVPACKEILKEKTDAQIRKGMNPRAFRALIVGIPNVGKSTLINRLAGRNVAATGDRPGITKSQQWIRAGGELELLDTPGILWPKFEDPEVGYKLAITGAIKEEILHVEDVAFYAIRYMMALYPDKLMERFDLEELPKLEPVEEDPQPIVDVMEQIGRRRGCIVSGGKVDITKTSGIILRELRSGKMDRLSLEQP